MNRLPTSVFATLMLILLDAAFWLIFAIIVALGVIRSIAAAGVIRWAMVILALGTSVVLAGIVLFLRRRNRLAFYAGVILLATIAVLSITDQIGLPDLFMLLINLFALGLMLKDRSWYLQSSNATSRQN
jgi:hypothetical protein